MRNTANKEVRLHVSGAPSATLVHQVLCPLIAQRIQQRRASEAPPGAQEPPLSAQQHGCGDAALDSTVPEHSSNRGQALDSPG